MRIIGIDPGLRTTGFGVIDRYDSRLQYVASGTIQTARTTGAERHLAQRLKIIFDGINEVVARYRSPDADTPTQAAIEIVFVNINPQSTLLLGQARGACLVALAHNGLDVSEYTALQMKQAIVGYGRASKTQIQSMVQKILNLSATPRPDAADALGIAITHALAQKALSNLRSNDLLDTQQLLSYRSRRKRRT